MSPLIHLVGFGLRQVIGDYADGVGQVAAAVEQRFRDHSRTLPKALDQAHQRAWQALGVALAGDGLIDRVKVFFASGDDKGVREQVHCFLTSNAVSFDGAPADFRRDCLDELKRLRKSGMLSATGGSAAAVARQAAGFRRHADPQGLIEESRRAVAGVADVLAEGYPNLSRLLRAPTPDRPPLLAAAFCYFFRREVETDDELAHGLFFDGLRQLSASQAKAFGDVGKALAALGGQFDAVLEQLDRVEAAVVGTHGAVLDVQAELQRLGGLHLANAGEVRALLEQVLSHLAQAGMARGEVRPGDSCSIRSEDERRAVKALLARFRQLPAEEQRQTPALLYGLGKLQVGAGDFAEARQTFTEVVQAVGDPSDKAEASFNAYRAALEEKKWDAALAALREAGSLDPRRFAPFPLDRYEPKRILGAGGFGAGVLCRDRYFDEDVVVKTLHAADLASGADDVFREARILRRLSHPAIIGVRNCDYADPMHKARAYLVMDYFAGGTLQQFVDERGPLNLEQLLSMAVQMAEGMRAAHAQGVLHRDLKPANLLVRKEGDLWKVKIIDFGLALRQQTVETSRVRIGATQKSTLDWSVAGTLDYAPPEQLGKLPGVLPGSYSDAYAFARTCCYAMFKATELRRKQWDSLPGPLADLLEGCLDPDPHQRPQGFEPVLAVLRECSRVGEKVRHREQEERLRREQEVEQRRQREGEEQLRQLVRAALVRTAGKPIPDDTTKAKELCRRHKLAADRANAVIREVKDAWRQEREEQEREQKMKEEGTRRRQEQEEQQRQGATFDQAATSIRNATDALGGFIASSVKEAAARRLREEQQRQQREEAARRQSEGSGGFLQRSRAVTEREEAARGEQDVGGVVAPVPLCAACGADLGPEVTTGCPKCGKYPWFVPQSRRQDKAGALFTNSLGMKFAWIPPGTFVMGSPADEMEYEGADESQHKVTLTKGFHLGIHQVTQAQWQAVMGANPSNLKGESNLPVENVSWDDCVAFCEALGKKDGKTYRLPTEAEWEYACRAGTTTPFHFGDTISVNQSNYDGKYIYGNGKKGVYRQKTTPVGGFPANAWGLFDIHGNVWEWCADWFGPYQEGDLKDQQGFIGGQTRVLRGGSWNVRPGGCRSAFRFRLAPGFRGINLGCRVALCLD